MRKYIIPLLLALILLLNTQAFAATSSTVFQDIENFSWARDAINQLAQNGIISGTGNQNFSPGSSITRADFIVIMARLLELDVEFSSNFADVPATEYYYNAVGMARALGLISGVDSQNFAPRSPITREAMFAITHRIISQNAQGPSNTSTSNTLSFVDADEISDWAKQPISELSNLIQGDDSNRINPRNNSTRAETAVFVSRVQSQLTPLPTATPIPTATPAPTTAPTPTRAPTATPTPRPTRDIPRIAVFAGHGGSDPGVVSGGIRESDLSLLISNRVTQILRGLGYEVINNRTTDVDRDIAADAQLANDNDVSAVVEIHFNSNSGEIPGTGTESYHSVFSQGEGKKLASEITGNIAALGFVNRGARTRTNSSGQDYYGIIRLTSAPTVLAEVCFMNNPDDMALYNSVGPERIAQSIVDGILEIFPIRQSGTSPTPTPSYQNYTVVSGDTLWAISQRFGTTVDAIMALNGLTERSVNTGQVLKIPN